MYTKDVESCDVASNGIEERASEVVSAVRMAALFSGSSDLGVHVDIPAKAARDA